MCEWVPGRKLRAAKAAAGNDCRWLKSARDGLLDARWWWWWLGRSPVELLAEHVSFVGVTGLNLLCFIVTLLRWNIFLEGWVVPYVCHSDSNAGVECGSWEYNAVQYRLILSVGCWTLWHNYFRTFSGVVAIIT